MDAKEKARFDVLYAKHLRALKLHGKAPTTVDVYARAVRRVVERFGCCPDRLSIEQFQTHFAELIDTRSWSLVKIDLCGLQFFFKHALEMPWPWLGIVQPPVKHTLPDVLSLEEIARIVLATRERRYQTFWWTTYSMGLRLNEALTLRVGDIDASRGLVHVRSGKGLRDRFVVLPKLTLGCLRRYWSDHRHPFLLFPKADLRADLPMDCGTTQKAFARVIADCKINKRVSIHSLRHAYATHLIEAGMNLRSAQELMGHQNPSTTARYVHMTDKTRDNQRQLIDGVMEQLRDALRGLQA